MPRLPVRLFHVSDVHFGREDKAAVAWFDQLVRDEKPDAVIMTGDLTMRARSTEYDDGLRWLRGLGVPVTVEVGNHDLPAYNLLKRLFRPYHRIHKVEKLVEQPLDLPGVTIIPLKTTARWQWRLDWSKGSVSPGSLGRALALLAEAPKDKLAFIAAHHPLIDVRTQASAQTHGGAKALEALAGAGADAVLTGHVHDPFDIRHKVAGREVRMIGAGTLSERTRDTPPSFNEVRVVGGKFEVICRTMAPTPDQPLPVEKPATA